MTDPGATSAEPIDPEHIEMMAMAAAGRPGGPVALLQAIQARYHYISDEALEAASEASGIALADLEGVAGFYAQFRRRPAGRHDVKVCVGTACHVKGAPAVLDALRSHLGITSHDDTDADRLFTVRGVACLGCCMLAPAVQIDDMTYGFVTPDRAGSVLRDFLGTRARGPSGPVAPPVSGALEIRTCLCSSCDAAGAGKVFRAFQREIAGRPAPLSLSSVGCTGISYLAPLVEVALPGGETYRYGRVRPEQASAILDEHAPATGFLSRLRSRSRKWLTAIVHPDAVTDVVRFGAEPRDRPDAAYTLHQKALATEGGGRLDPLDLAGYEAAGGLSALRKTLEDLDPAKIIDTVQASGLRGRGGAGFPTGRKWRSVAQTPGAEKIVVANGDEGDPGAFMDRMILESHPFRVLEGMTLAAIAVGAQTGLAYVRAEYPLAVARLRQAVETARTAGWLGGSILGAGPVFDVDVVEGAGAFVCGEETALLAALEGRRGTPRFRPPYPAQNGFRGLPTLVNNVETLASIPWILRHGAGAFRSLGTPSSPGTKTFALAGKVRRGGLVEVPMGMTLRQVVEDIGGGVPQGRDLKAVLIGGPSGGCVPASLADTPVDFDALTEAGAMMGSGGLVVLDDSDCMVEVARYFLAFTQAESCGRCTFCRVGTRRLLEMLEALVAGEAREADLEALETLCRDVSSGSLCNLGKTAPNPVLSALTHFREEFVAHTRGRCPAGRCKALITYAISGKCIGCTRCAQRCPSGAIRMTPYERHAIDPALCIRCDSCRQVCPEGAVEVI